MALTKRQLEMRARRIGGSEIAALAGFSRWKRPIEIYEAHRLLLEGREPPEISSLPIDFGTEFEEPIARVVAKRTGKWFARCDSVTSNAHEYAIATPDRAVFPSQLQAPATSKALGLEEIRQAEYGLEIKSTTWRSKAQWGPDGTDQAPLEYLAQCTWCMGVTGHSRWDLAVLFDRDEIRVLTVRFSADLFARLYELAAPFMVDHVLAGRPPPPDASEQYAEFLDRSWASNSKTLVQADDATSALALELAYVEAAIDRLGDRDEFLRNKLKAVIGDAAGVDLGVLRKIK